MDEKTAGLPAFINQHIALVRFNSPKLDSRFVSYFLASAPAQKRFLSGTDVGAKAGMSLQGVANTLVALPPYEEQKAIADTLVDIDGLLAEQDKLIAKKRDIKKGAMQELLTGKRRLPGFSEKWRVAKLGHVLKVRHGKSQHAVVKQDGKYPILATSGEIGRTDSYLCDKPSVLIGRKGTIDVPQYMESPFWTIDTLFYTEIESSFPKFIYYLFCTIKWQNYNEASGVPSLSASRIEGIDVLLPNYDEQLEIANLLSDMDSEIATLEAQREKTAALKQGMMQQLLTGKIRLT